MTKRSPFSYLGEIPISVDSAERDRRHRSEVGLKLRPGAF